MLNFRLQKKILICSQVQGPQNVILCFAPASQNGLKGKMRDLKQMFEKSLGAKEIYKGGRGALAPRPPL